MEWVIFIVGIDLGLAIATGFHLGFVMMQHKYAKINNPTDEQIEEFTRDFISLIEEKALFPHHVWFLRYTINKSMEEWVEERKKQK